MLNNAGSPPREQANSQTAKQKIFSVAVRVRGAPANILNNLLNIHKNKILLLNIMGYIAIDNDEYYMLKRYMMDTYDIYISPTIYDFDETIIFVS